jgi:hypothetical protein
MGEDESLYGANAITGSTDDALKALEGRDVEIKSSNTQTVTVGAEAVKGAEEESKVDEKKPDAPLSPEEALEADVQNAVKADADARTDLAAKGIDFKALETEFENEGALSADSLAKLEAAGYPKSMVDAYISGMNATAEKFTNAVHGFTGGAEGFAALTAYVQSLGVQNVNAFNAVVRTGDLTQIKMIIQGFQSQMESTQGKDPSRVILGDGMRPGGQPQGFTDRAAMVKAMSDPRYSRDKAYTQEVEFKTSRSTFL